MTQIFNITIDLMPADHADSSPEKLTALNEALITMLEGVEEQIGAIGREFDVHLSIDEPDPIYTCYYIDGYEDVNVIVRAPDAETAMRKVAEAALPDPVITHIEETLKLARLRQRTRVIHATILGDNEFDDETFTKEAIEAMDRDGYYEYDRGT